jgi:hypothetical protein
VDTCAVAENRGGARMTPQLQSEAKAAVQGPVDALGCNQRRRRDAFGSGAGHGKLQSETGPGAASNK